MSLVLDSAGDAVEWLVLLWSSVATMRCLKGMDNCLKILELALGATIREMKPEEVRFILVLPRVTRCTALYASMTFTLRQTTLH